VPHLPVAAVPAVLLLDLAELPLDDVSNEVNARVGALTVLLCADDAVLLRVDGDLGLERIGLVLTDVKWV
jgi:hypothetical protein